MIKTHIMFTWCIFAFCCCRFCRWGSNETTITTTMCGKDAADERKQQEREKNMYNMIVSSPKLSLDRGEICLY